MSAPNPIQDRIKAQVLLNPWFTIPGIAPAPNRIVPFLTADDGDIESELEKHLNVLQGGLAGTILIPFGSAEEKTGVTVPKLIVEVSFAEYVLYNRSARGFNKKAYDAVRKISAPWKRDNTGGLNFWNPGPPFTRLEFSHFEELGAKLKSSNKALVIYRALFECTEAIE